MCENRSFAIRRFSLIPRLGVYGVAVSNIAVNALLSFVCFLILYKQGYIKPSKLQMSDLRMLKEWAKTGFFSGLQQFIDNIVYALMVCKMVNAVSGQGDYWVANNFIWGWLLIPVSALSEVIRRDCKDGEERLNRFNYFFVITVSIALWWGSLPLWKPFFRTAERLENAEGIFSITVKLVPFYTAYACSAVFDNIFIGLGKTSYAAINSCIVNFVYYGVFYALYRAGALAFTMNTIVVMFGCGMIVHFIVSAAQDAYLRRKTRQLDKIRE